LIRSASNRKHKRWQAGLVGIVDALAAAASIRDVQMYSRADMKSAGAQVLKPRSIVKIVGKEEGN
jgi:hypothetical protein